MSHLGRQPQELDAHAWGVRVRLLRGADPQEQAERFWNTFGPIGQALGIRFSRKELDRRRSLIILERIRTSPIDV